VRNVTDISWMFRGTLRFNQSLQNWNINQDVTDTRGVFYRATSLRSKPSWSKRTLM
jgi:hypothetical protein